jgi:FKBP-type peptidyl-prolyl cis-trans isomerase 2
VRRIGDQLEAGTVWLNEVHQYSPHQAFGGHKQSGIGCENALHGLMEYTNWRTVTLNKAAAFGASNGGHKHRSGTRNTSAIDTASVAAMDLT